MVIEIKGYHIQIDEEDAGRVMAHSWWVSSSPEIDGHVLCFSTKVGKKIIKLHRFIMGDHAGRIVDQITHPKVADNIKRLRNKEMTRP